MPPATTRPQPRSLEVDAYFDDEWATAATAKGGIAMNPRTGCHFNKFDVAVAASRTATKQFPNPLQDPSIALQLEQGAQDTNNYRIFVPTGLGGVGPAPGEVIPVTLYAGPGAEFCRHGLRTFFDATTSQVLVGMPGTEPTTWGYGITKAQIDQLFAAVGLGGVAWAITVLVAFSTGYQGINGTINNTKSTVTPAPAGTPTSAKPGLGLDLSGVKKLVFFDCLYRGDQPAPGRNTDRALAALNAFTGGTCEAIVYEVTGGGTPRDAGTLRANFPKGMKMTLLNLKPLTNQLIGLILARRIDNGIKDGFTNEAEVKSLGGQPVLDLIKKLPATRSIASSTATGTTTLANWAPTATCNQAAGLAETMRDKILVGAEIKPPPGAPPPKSKRFANELMGWAPPAMGEALHDGFMSEFGWEHMAG